MGSYRLLRFRLDRKPETARQPDPPHHPQPVFFDPLMGVADRADHFRLQIRAPIHIIEDLIPEWVIKHPIDGEIASFGVLYRSRKLDLCRPSSILVIKILPEGGHLVLPPLYNDQYDPKSDPDRHGMRKKGLHGFGRRVRCD